MRYSHVNYYFPLWQVPLSLCKTEIENLFLLNHLKNISIYSIQLTFQHRHSLFYQQKNFEHHKVIYTTVISLRISSSKIIKFRSFQSLSTHTQTWNTHAHISYIRTWTELCPSCELNEHEWVFVHQKGAEKVGLRPRAEFAPSASNSFLRDG